MALAPTAPRGCRCVQASGAPDRAGRSRQCHRWHGWCRLRHNDRVRRGRARDGGRPVLGPLGHRAGAQTARSTSSTAGEFAESATTRSLTIAGPLRRSTCPSNPARTANLRLMPALGHYLPQPDSLALRRRRLALRRKPRRISEPCDSQDHDGWATSTGSPGAAGEYQLQMARRRPPES